MTRISRRAAIERGLYLVGAGFWSACASTSEGPRSSGSVLAQTVPLDRPSDWNPVSYNIERGKLGFIPPEQLAQIQQMGGIEKYLGSHLPYVVALPPDRQPPGYLPLMFGNPAEGYEAYASSQPSPEDPKGHWFDWIRCAVANDASSEAVTRFDTWPEPSAAVNGKIVGFDSPSPVANGGRNSVYQVVLPKSASSGTVVRIWAHCTLHGEYVDFITLG